MNIDNFLINNVHIVPGSTVILGISGGPDSMALLSLMQEFIKKVPLKLVVAHVNHNVRKESPDELNMVQNYCQKWGIIFESMVINNYDGYNFHAEARDKRYFYFNQLIDKYNASYLMTAHHGDDLIETIMMRLIRGSSMKGYAGIEPIIDMGNYKVIRPLLPYTKEDLIKYDESNDIPYAIDSTNKDNTYLRNRIRNNILPSLKKEDSNIQKKFIKFSNLVNEYSNYIDKQVANIMPLVYENNNLNIIEFNKQENLIKRLIINNILLSVYKENIIMIDDNNVDEIIKIINSTKPNITISLPNNYCCYKAYNNLTIKKEIKVKAYDIIFNDKSILPNGKIIERIDECEDDSNYVARFSLADISLPLHIRSRHAGDIMPVRGLNGSQKVNDIFTNFKLKTEERNLWPIVTDNNGKIVWIPGVKKSVLCHRKNEKYDIILKYLI